MKKLKVFALAAVMAISVMTFLAPNTAISADKAISVKLDGKKLSLSTPPRLVNGQVMVPISSAFEAMGATVLWNKDTKTVTLLRRDSVVKLVVGKKNAMVDSKKKSLSTPAQIYKNKVYLPLRFVSESLGGKVSWNSKTQLMTITTDKAHWSDPGDNLSINLLFKSQWVNTDTGEKMTFDPETFIQINEKWPDGSDDIFYSYSETNESERNIIGMFSGGAFLKNHWLEFDPNTRVLTEYMFDDALTSWEIAEK